MADIINIIELDSYVPKVYHKQIYFNIYSQKWEWLPYAVNTHKEMMSKKRDKDYYISDTKIGSFIKGLKPIIRDVDKSVVDDADIMFIRDDNGYFMAISGHYKPINIRKFNYKI